MKKTRIIIADDQALMRDGLKTILENEENFEIVALAEDGLKALELSKELKPDMILMDIRMPVMDGVECVRHIKKELAETKVIMLTTFNDDEYIMEALSYGADGYLLKSIQAQTLIDCINDTLSGIFTMNSDIASKVASNLSNASIFKGRGKNILYDDFTEREAETAACMIEGLTNREIAAKLCITEGTVKNYISVIYEKLGTNERIKAVTLLKSIFNN